MICPVCGNNTPDSLGECQFCSTPLSPVKVLPQVTQQPYMPQQTMQPHYGMPQQGATMPQQVMPQQTAMPQYPAAMQPYGAAPQPQYPAAAQQTAATAQPADNTAVSAEEEFNEEEHEKKVSSGTLTSLLVWFAVVGLLLAFVHFNVPEMISNMIKGGTVSDSDISAEENISPDEMGDTVPVNDPFYGTWVLCTYNVQNLADGTVTGGQHYTHEKPLQFYTFENGKLHRCLGEVSSMLEHTDLTYTYTDGVFSGAVLEGGSESPEIAVSGNSMCIYDTLDINGNSCYVEYALLRPFDGLANDAAIAVYASSVESGAISLPQYSSNVMTDATTLTTTTPAPTSDAAATYNMIGTWLLISKESVKYGTDGTPISNNKPTIENGGLDYNYVVFDMDGDYNYFTLKFSEDMSECISDEKKSGSFEFKDGLLDFAPSGNGISVSQSDTTMYFTYIIDHDDYSENVREEYKFISSEEYSKKQLMELRPEL